MVSNPQPKEEALALLQMGGEWTYSQIFLLKIKCSGQICIILYTITLCLTFRINHQCPTVPDWGRQGDITYCSCNSPNAPRSVAAPRLWVHCFLCQEISSGLIYLAHSSYSVLPHQVQFPSHYLSWFLFLFLFFLSQWPNVLPVFGDCPNLWGTASYHRRCKCPLFWSLLPFGGPRHMSSA